MEMYLRDWDGGELLFAVVDSVDAGRALWCAIAGVTAGQTLMEFVITDGGQLVYRGDYATDEC